MLLKFADWFVYEILKFSVASKIGSSIHFFVYDSIKILLLLFVLIFIIGVIRTFLPQKKIKKWMLRGGGVGIVSLKV